jgi:hypothetical protein
VNTDQLNKYATDVLNININDPIWVGSSLSKKNWLANRMIYEEKEDKLNYVNRLYESAVSQHKLNVLVDSNPHITKESIMQVQKDIYAWKKR